MTLRWPVALAPGLVRRDAVGAPGLARTPRVRAGTGTASLLEAAPNARSLLGIQSANTGGQDTARSG